LDIDGEEDGTIIIVILFYTKELKRFSKVTVAIIAKIARAEGRAKIFVKGKVLAKLAATALVGTDSFFIHFIVLLSWIGFCQQRL
jgi:hypothetical protein